MHCRTARILTALAALALCACASLPPADELENGSTYLVAVDAGTDGLPRTYRVHIPRAYRPGESTPLVVVVHGAFSTSGEMEEQSGFSALADEQGFLVAYPDGIGILGLLQHWNAGHCCGKAAADGIDDVGFIAEVIAHVKSYASVDEHRVYMVGYSNGAMLTHRFAAERPELLAAAAPLAGAIGSSSDSGEPLWSMPAAGSALPIIMFHGLRDETIPYAEPDPEETSSTRRYAPVSESSRYWSSHNGCLRHERRRGTISVAVIVDTWSGCDDDATVQLISLDDWGHRWPGAFYTDKIEPQNALYGFDAAQIIWSFFQRHSRSRRDV